ncbi:MAG: copper ABC transporter substrate-binding protein [Sphingomonadaceae bacterium]|nr:copper ABC transporter substrate-binding protein [Sphingomonadaceae bacterium]
MKTQLILAALIALPLGLSGCDKKPEAPKVEASADAMGEMAMPTAVKHGKGIGTVTAIDPSKGTITLDHGEISELQWPAMKMGFAARPEVLTNVKVGDKVHFEIDWDGKAGTVTAIGLEP